MDGTASLNSAKIIKKLPILVFGFLAFLLFLSLQISGKTPVVKSITPKIGLPGEVLEITGSNFGTIRGMVSISGINPVSSAYLEWSPGRIRVLIPEDAVSGFVHVKTAKGPSAGVLFTNKNDIPVIVRDTVDSNLPFIERLEPERGPVGGRLTILGKNFGSNRENGLVYFTWVTAAETAGLSSAGTLSHFIPAAGIDFDYEGWSDREIRLRVPMGAISGNIMVMNEEGTGNTVYFEVDQSVGTQIYKDKRTYTVQSSVDIRNVSGGGGNGLYLWVPRVQESPSQRDVQLLNQEPKAEIENYNGLMHVFLKNLNRGRTYRVAQTFILDRYAIESKINPERLKVDYDTDRALYKVYTASNAFTPADNPEIGKVVGSTAGREKNPYFRAQRLYSNLLGRMTYNSGKNFSGALKGLEEKQGDSYTYATLYVAFLRNAGIPSRTISGYIITDEKTAVPHFWCEFYLENYGWVPVDPALGDKAAIKGFPLPSDPQSYYFGNMDNRHIAFSRGLVQAKRVSPHGRTIEQPEIHSLQTIYAEVVGDLQSYSATWNNLQVVGVY
jgi:hypothetical protein